MATAVRSSRPDNLPHPRAPADRPGAGGRGRPRLLLRDDVRLLTLTGPGGVGKTRLALAAAAELAADVRRRRRLRRRSPRSRDPDLVAPTIAQALGRAGGRRPAARRAAGDASCATGDLLLVLDNFEQVLAAAPLVAACSPPARG